MLELNPISDSVRPIDDLNSSRACAAAGSTMVQLFEDYPVTESLLLWYPTLIAAAELTLPLIRSHVDKCVRQQVVFASTSFFMTLANVETWHFMILYAATPLYTRSLT